MQVIDTRTTSAREIRARLTRSASLGDAAKEAAVRDIIEDVRARGDEALLDYGRRWDCPKLETLRITPEAIAAAHAACDPTLLETMRGSKANIERFHRQQMPRSWFDGAQDGIILGQLVQPVHTVGLYVPGGTAAYPSTVLMTAVPALVAGVSRIIICTPPDKSGQVNPLVLAAAHECGISDVFAVGGAQAIGAMAYGTETVPGVDVICGPGNIYVLLAKKMVVGSVNIESLPGPSEICVVADDTANPRFVAADMLSQAEHGGVGASSAAVLITPSRALADAVQAELARQAATQSRRAILEQALEEAGLIVITRDVDEALDLANLMAPEHLELEIENAWNRLSKVRNAGAIMIGPWSTEPVADYWAGPSHVLPTSGTARFYGPLSVDIFLKKSSIVCYDEARLREAAPNVIRFAEAEGLDAHANAVRVRVEDPA
ncbi:MAG TPA: histidinol dehydrogenase [Armatimonadota bacterium]|jgi:histidinol dehydrogenase